MLNKKGFTLVELLGVIVILGVISAIIVPLATQSLDKSRDRNEEIFKKRLAEAIDSYITENTNVLKFSSTAERTITKGVSPNSYTVKVYKSTDSITFNSLVTSKVLADPITNPKNKSTCSLSTPITIYRDTDYVYCYKVTNINCLTLNKSINTCSF